MVGVVDFDEVEMGGCYKFNGYFLLLFVDTCDADDDDNDACCE